jgi:hypothetical protein
MFNQLPELNVVQAQDYLETQVVWVRVYTPEGAIVIILDTALTLDTATFLMSVVDIHLLTGQFTPSNPQI